MQFLLCVGHKSKSICDKKKNISDTYISAVCVGICTDFSLCRNTCTHAGLPFKNLRKNIYGKISIIWIQKVFNI